MAHHYLHPKVSSKEFDYSQITFEVSNAITGLKMGEYSAKEITYDPVINDFINK